ncbi:MAG: hypothetical protein ACMVO3_22920 [Thalassobaculum sp.]
MKNAETTPQRISWRSPDRVDRQVSNEMKRGRREARQAAARETPDQKFARALAAGGERFQDAAVSPEPRIYPLSDHSALVVGRANG